LPQIGVVYAPDDATHLRLAAWQGMGVPAVGDAALAPTTLAGILLNRPGDNSQLVKAFALDGDRQLSSTLLLDAKAQRREADQPVIYAAQQVLFIQQIDESQLALRWQPQGKPWAASLAYDDERIQNDPTTAALNSVDNQRLYSEQLGIRWFASERCTASLKWSHNHVTGTYRLTDPFLFTPTLLLPYQDSFNQLDAEVSWKFNRRGSLDAGVRNATNTSFQYTDIDPLIPRFSMGRLTYAKVKLAW
jgi:outer membrane receptor protein involved in Fe transport